MARAKKWIGCWSTDFARNLSKKVVIRFVRKWIPRAMALDQVVIAADG
jgi:hypothetical protein